MKKENIEKVYEIGYLLVSSIPGEKVAEETSSLKELISKAGAEFIGEEAPELRPLAYTMAKKIGSVNHKFDEGYFGWFKFSLSSGDIESVKKSFEENPHVLRALVINTIKENTYLGKKSPVPMPEVPVESVSAEIVSTEPVTAPASIEEMDKSIDAMVKEV